jgi:Major intrinsic protein/Low molecular weight phosphotyrosine protein phosphatase
LVTLIFTFGPISGGHFNPAVTLADASQGGISWRDVPAYIGAQLLGAFIGLGAAHLMFGEALGIDISGHRSKHVDEFQGQSFDYVLTVCDNARESCPVFPGHAKRIHNAFEDPAVLHGTEEERLALFRLVRNEIRDYLKTFPAKAG